MAIEITIPRLGWSMDEGLFAEWSKQDGDFVAAGDPIFLLETDKALQEVESVDAGTLHIRPDGPQEGDTVRVGTVIGYLLEEGEEPPAFQPDVKVATESGGPPQPVTGPAPAEHNSKPGETSPKWVERATISSNVAASPAVRRLARELGVEIATLHLSGRISEQDIHRAAEGKTVQRPLAAELPSMQIAERNAHPTLPKISPRAVRLAKRFRIDWTQINGSGRNGRIREQDVRAATGNAELPNGTLVAATSIRKLIASRLAESWRTTVPVTLTTAVDVSAILRHRAEAKEQAAQEDAVPALHDYFIQAVAHSLQEFPALNSRWINGEILQPDGIHIGLAVDTETGLSVPVVRDADRLNLSEIAESTANLIRRARDRKLTTPECTGGTFTISNLGSFGIDAFTPIINLGESAILGIGTVREMPQRAADGGIHWSPQMTLSLTFDHQVVDGAPAARFLQQLGGQIARAESQS